MVFVTKYRWRVFSADHLRHLEEIFRAVCADFEAELAQFNGETDHVHLLVNYPPARIMRRDHPDLARRFWRGHLWSPSYFAGSVGGAPLSVLRQYVENQQRPEAAPRAPIPPRPEGRGLSARPG